jgi:hypothetical protein
MNFQMSKGDDWESIHLVMVLKKIQETVFKSYTNLTRFGRPEGLILGIKLLSLWKEFPDLN